MNPLKSLLLILCIVFTTSCATKKDTTEVVVPDDVVVVDDTTTTGNDDEKVEEKIEDRMMKDIMGLPKVKELNNSAFMLDSEPSANQAYYKIAVGINSGGKFTTVYWFHVYPNPQYHIMEYDVLTDSEIPVSLK